MGRGESGGSVGWVMHEYTLTDPSCPPHKICHVTFTGHGKNRKRVPGGDVVNDCQSEPAPKRARVDAASGGWASSGSGWTTTTVDQVSGAVVASADHQEPAQYVLAGEDIKERLQGMSSFAASSNAEPCCFEEYVQAGAPTTEQQLPEHAMMMPQPMVQETAGMAELEHMYLCGGSEDQPEFLASLGVSLDELRDVTGIDVAGIGDMDAGGQSAGDNWGGFQ
ncbi:hypothetical protein BAE44_0017468 [Dichanthelium oligosanthes]|uniref:NAC domain-containing protein n=1 Tax=Dichanthelium oligosanthes TaxID=888268 RepID=A0A1E5V937_9POAL|nr:hypothetical protein BAE44_0017468 [Dichanthelium oligosanthes]